MERPGRRRFVALAMVGLLAAATIPPSCSSDDLVAEADPEESTTTTDPDAADVDTDAADQDRPEGTSLPAPFDADWPGPLLLVTALEGNLVGIDLRSGRRTVLANGSALAEQLGLPDVRFESADLVDEEPMVAFVVRASCESGCPDSPGTQRYGLYEVPADGSTPPARVPIDGADGSIDRVRYSPDGRFVAVSTAEGLVVLDDRRRPVGPPVPMPYPPRWLTWSRAGDALLWLEHWERTSCCTRGSVGIDPATGRLAGELTREPTDGPPYVDATGSLATLPPDLATFSVDASGRYVIANDGRPGLQWWDLADDAGTPHPLRLEGTLQEVPPLAW